MAACPTKLHSTHPQFTQLHESNQSWTFVVFIQFYSCRNVVSMVTRLGVWDSYPEMENIFYFSPKLSDYRPVSYLIGSPFLFWEEKCPGREGDHSLPPCTEVKNGWRSTSISHIRLHGVDRDNFKFYEVKILNAKSFASPN